MKADHSPQIHCIRTAQIWDACLQSHDLEDTVPIPEALAAILPPDAVFTCRIINQECRPLVKSPVPGPGSQFQYVTFLITVTLDLAFFHPEGHFLGSFTHENWFIKTVLLKAPEGSTVEGRICHSFCLPGSIHTPNPDI